jgi:predicted site-specific integrase-resolvase
MESATTQPKYLRPRRVAEQYGISIATVYRWIRDKKIDGVSKADVTLVLVESVEQYLSTWRRR